VHTHANDESQGGRSRPSPCHEQAPGPSLEPLLGEIRQKHGAGISAILVYGSWLRGKRDTMLDFYVLVDDYRTLDSRWQALMCRLLPPNVYHIHHRGSETDAEPAEARAKYALLTLRRFRAAMERDFHSYFWARFAQPCEVLYVRDDDSRQMLDDAFTSARNSFLARVVPAMGDRFSSKELWTRGLALTYQCELRTESSNRGDSIYDFNPAYYDRVTARFAAENPALLVPESGQSYRNRSSGPGRSLSSLSWATRRVQGKLLSLLRLTKAAFTFNDALEYLLWKIERHSGLYIEPTPRQLRHPLIFAWPLLFRLYRQGAFR
jgi:hypothetical protein